MKSLISRESYRPDKRYSGIYHVQGSMVTDADLDERSRITQDRTDNLGDDTIKDGVPGVGGAVAIAEGDILSLQEGVIYADGVRGVETATAGANLNTPLALFSHQADFPESPALPGDVDQIIYADIWERPVYPLEDPYLADTGLHGAVTAFRTRTMTQLKAAPLTALADIENGSGNFPQIGTGKLALTPNNAFIQADDCDPCADVVPVEQTIANALWRLEVIDVTGTPEAPGTITLAWSIENAAAIAFADIAENKFERSQKVYEFFSETTESHLGVFANASDAHRSVFVDDMSAMPQPAVDLHGQALTFVRRWDGQAVINTGTNTVNHMGGGFNISIAGKVVELTVEAFKVELDLNDAAIVAGDYWLVELRRHATLAERVRLVQATPFGVIHHYCTLFRVDTSGNILPPTDAEIRKLSFPTLSDLPATHSGFDNKCSKLYDNADNVQEALDNLCDISADDIDFTPKCDELYGNADNVQDALDALCNIDFSVHASFRRLFDWGVLCGIVPSLVKAGTSKISITQGSFMDRSGRITGFDGEIVDLNELRLGREILFETERDVNLAMQAGNACLALAAHEGGKVTVHLVPSSLAYGPDDPGFSEVVRECIKQKDVIDLDKVIEKMPQKRKAVAYKVMTAWTSNDVLGGSAKLTEAEAKQAEDVNEILVNEFQKRATQEESELLVARVKQAKEENPIGDTQGAARQVRLMQMTTAVFAQYLRSDEERMLNCICKALFPTCPPALGKAPFFVPVACIRGKFDNNTFFLSEVCPFCCRKQAMTWRSLQYFIGEGRDQLAKKFAEVCCGRIPDSGGKDKPGSKVDPGWYTEARPAYLLEKYKLMDTLVGQQTKSPTDYRTIVPVNDLNEAEAKLALIGNGIDIAETIDVDDEKAMDIIEQKSVGVTGTDRLISAGSVRPGDKVGLLLQDGIARGYVLLEKGSGKPLFSVAKSATASAVVTEADELRAKKLLTATTAAKNDLVELNDLRKSLSEDVTRLKTDVVELGVARESSIAAVKEVRDQLTELANTRTALTAEMKKVNNELVQAEKNRKTIRTAVRKAQPVTVVIGNDNPELISKLAGVKITTVADISKLTPTRIRQLERARVIEAAAANELVAKARDFLKQEG